MTGPPKEVRKGRVDTATYRIRVSGALGADWSARSHGMTITVEGLSSPAVVTELRGPLPDQSALMGVLERLDTHGAQLLAVERLDGARPESRAQAHEKTIASSSHEEVVR